jgi:hypothetical protein
MRLQGAAPYACGIFRDDDGRFSGYARRRNLERLLQNPQPWWVEMNLSKPPRRHAAAKPLNEQIFGGAHVGHNDL